MIRLSIVSAVAAAALSGCALLSSPDPVQTYRFGELAGEAATTAVPLTAPAVSLRRVEFPQAARLDRLLAVNGTETTPIKGVRWIAPAPDLYMESVENAFASRATRVRLIGAREQVAAATALDIDMRAFEARYDYAGAAPTVVLSARARLVGENRTTMAEQTFTVRQPAGDNRISAIVPAYDAAVRDLNEQIVTWTEQNVR